MQNRNEIKPERVFYYFTQIASIPHGSYHTKQISDYIKDIALQNGLECHQDSTDNLIIIKEAYTGYENSPTVILQGHIDMVCEKEKDSPINFETDGLDLYVEDGFLHARGTTLGGDDGIAVAYALAILEDKDIPHPRLEVVLTTNEEVGLIGAKEIDLSILKGSILLNIDSDLEGHFLTSCAGGVTAGIHMPVNRQILQGITYRVSLNGLLGGHSGTEIHQERANAVLLLARIIKEAEMTSAFSIVTFFGGKKDNAIPREAEAELIVEPEYETIFLDSIQETVKHLKNEYRDSDSMLAVDVTRLDIDEAYALDRASCSKLLFLLRNLPNGVMNRSALDDSFVEASLNCGVMQLSEEELHLCTSIRSSVSTRKYDLLNRVTFLGEFLGAEVEIYGDYSAWEYNPDSVVREKIRQVYTNMFGTVPIFEGIHAGLECGVLAPKIHNMDAVSFGPINLDIHTTMERLDIASVERVYQFLLALLKEMK
ncbi:MAG: aminoacyl-histidine dipeptidase [Lachnospiraceae bacterium]